MFENVTYGGLGDDCSPPFEWEEPDGLKINAPPSATIRADGLLLSYKEKLPLCMTAKFKLFYIERFHHLFKAVNVVLVDDDRHETFGGQVWRHRTEGRLPPHNIPVEEQKTRMLIERYTVNLLEHIKLPARKARYTVYALLEQHKSNVVHIEITPE
jgi:hypothetical protein